MWSFSRRRDGWAGELTALGTLLPGWTGEALLTKPGVSPKRSLPAFEELAWGRPSGPAADGLAGQFRA